MKTKHKILVIEDEDLIRSALMTILKEEDYEVIYAKDGLEGLALAEKEQPSLIILDLLLPKLDGQTMLERVRENPWGRDIPVIVYTNVSDAMPVHDTLKSGATHYYIKADTSSEELIKTIEKMLN